MEEKRCENCKYFLAHYIKKKTRLFQIGGHCGYSNINGKRGKKMCLHENCKKWERAEQQKDDAKKVISETLREMEKHLSEIALILKDEA